MAGEITRQELSDSLVQELDSKVNKNNPITAKTATKVTYDEKGLVTSGANLIESDIPTLSQSKITNLTTDLNKKANKISGGTDGNIVTSDSTGDIKDSGKKFNDTGNTTNDIWSASKVQSAIDAVLRANDAMVFKGVIDCSTNPNYPSGNAGETYKINGIGKIGGTNGVNVRSGDMLICTTNNTPTGDQATVGSKWTIVEGNIDGAVTSTDTSATDGQIVIESGTTGKAIKKSQATIDSNGNMNIPSGAKYKINGTDLSANDVGLGNVTNESKATMFTNPTFTGNPTAPTQTSTDNSTKIATTAFVKSQNYLTDVYYVGSTAPSNTKLLWVDPNI